MSEPRTDRVEDLAAAYVLGALSPEERHWFEAHLARFPASQRDVEEYREVASLLALAGSGAEPSTELRDRVLARVSAGKVRSLAPEAARRRTNWTAIAAGVVAAGGLGLAVNYRSELADARGRLAGLERTMADVRGRLEASEATLNAIFEPGVQMFQLTASGDPDPGIQLFWDRQRHRAILHGFRLRPVPADRAYQLWFIKDGAPVPSITFRPEPGGRVKVEQIPVPEDGMLSAAAVTVEPASGSAQPTSPIVLMGSPRQS